MDKDLLKTKVVPNIEDHLKEAKADAERLQKAGSDFYLYHQGLVTAFTYVLNMLDIVLD